MKKKEKQVTRREKWESRKKKRAGHSGGSFS